jgi:MYXO-CTERM domain-containing protein
MLEQERDPMRTIHPRTPWTKVVTQSIAHFAAGGVLFGVLGQKEALACGLPVPEPLYPTATTADIPTNAKLIFRGGVGVEPWLRKVNSSALDAGADAGIGPTGTGAEPGSDGGRVGAIPLEVACLEEVIGSLCFASAPLEANTSYVWGVDSEDVEYSESFTTGGSERAPQPLPDVEVEFEGFADGGGGGSCATQFYANLTAKFAPSPEPWVLWPTNPFDTPMFVSAGSAELAWASIDPTECFVIRQVNWEGQVSTTDVEVCVPAPPTSAIQDAGETSHDDTDVSASTSDAQAPSSRDASDAPSDAGSPTAGNFSSRDAATAPLVDAGNGGAEGLSNEDDGCSCRAPANKPSGALGWLTSLALALAYRRRHLARR